MTERRGIDPAFVVVAAGVSAALHVGKLPPAIPVLQEALGVTLVEAGFLLSLVQVAGMAFGIFAGLAADSVGLKRCMLAGLVTLSVAGMAGGFATAALPLLVLRAVEGFGFLLAVMPAPGLIRRLVARERLNTMLGLWSCYMPLGTALALLAGPLVMQRTGWPPWWWAIAVISFGMALWVWRAVPADARAAKASAALAPLTGSAGSAGSAASRGTSGTTEQSPGHWHARLARTLAARGPWLVALCFAVYSAQWLSLIGFLPSIYAQAGVAPASMGVLTALAAAVNMIGNIAAGRLLQRGVRPQWLLWAGFVAMAAGALAAIGEVGGIGLSPALRYAGVLLFSTLGGMIPATLFTLAVRLAPGDDTVSTTVGWVQQWSAIGQFVGPPLVGWLAARVGGWQWTWVATGGCALVGMLIAALLAERKPAGPGRRWG
ncbi:MAG: MFS transporter [Burkholderiales bacterium]